MSKNINRKSLRKALRSWDRTAELGHSSLAGLVIVEARRSATGYQPSETGYGLALRDVLQAAIRHLKPHRGGEDYYDKRWRAFLILTQQYLEGRSPDYLVEQMGVARSTYDHAQAEALDRIVGILGDWEGRGVFPEGAEFSEQDALAEPQPAFNVPPKPPHGLVGREQIVNDLRQGLFSSQVRLTLSGLPGVGKTALAITLAHDLEVREHFVDGILWAGLGQHANVLSQLSIWAVALGLPLGGITQLEDVRDRAQAVHAAIGHRRMLLVVDDVWDVVDGLALLVGGPNCAHLFTTRMPRMAIELAGAGAREIHELGEGDGEVLLRTFVPKIESEDARSLVKRVDGLPLGLVIIGKYLQGELRTGQPRRMREAVDRLENTGEVLQVTHPQSILDQQPSLPADLPLSLGAVIELSLNTLNEPTQATLVALSHFPPKPNTFSEKAALEISGAPAEFLDSLSDHGLLEVSGEGRYTLHRMVSELARQNFVAHPVHERYLGYFIQFVESNKGEHLLLERESQNIVAGLEMAREAGMKGALIRGVNAYFPHLEAMGLLDLAQRYLLYAETAARDLIDGSSLITTLSNLGKLAQRKADYVQSEKFYTEGLALAQELDEAEWECTILQGLGAVSFSLGDYETAARYYVRGLELVGDLNFPKGALGLNANMGTLVVTRGDLAVGEDYFNKALELARDLGDRANVSAMLTNLGILAARTGEYTQAQDYFQESLAIARATGMQKNIGYLLLNLGTLSSDQGDDSKAQGYFNEAIKMAENMGDRAQVSQLRGNLGALATKRGDYEVAESHLLQGLRIAREIGHPEHIIHLLINLGELHRKQGALEQANSTFQEALVLADEINHERYIGIVQDNIARLEEK